METTIKVINLKCHGCANTIKKGLLKFDEVSEVNIDVEKSLISILSDEDQDNTTKYTDKLKSMGYPQDKENSNFLLIKSFVSCAIGRIGASANEQ